MLALLLLAFISSAFSQECNPPFRPIGKGCYFYDRTLYIDSYPATIDFCASIGGYPVVVKHGSENRALINHFLPDNLLGDVVILGATRNDDGLFEWHLDDEADCSCNPGTLVRDTFDHWYPGEPAGDGDCLAWNYSLDMYWDDIICGNFNGSYSHVAFICEDAVIGTTPNPTGSTVTPTGTMTPTTDGTPNDCFEPFVDLGIGCYYASENQPQSWSGSRIQCENLGGYLAVITSAEEQAVIASYVDSVFPTPIDDLWIGLYDQNDNDVYVWIDDTPVNYVNWASGEPDGANNNYAFLSDSDGWAWGDELNSVEQFYLCEADGGSGTNPTDTTITSGTPTPSTTSGPFCDFPWTEIGTGCYYASAGEPESWSGSRALCQALGGDLAVITSEEEQTAVADFLDAVYPVSTDDVWIGGYDRDENDVFHWIDDSPFTYTNWATDEPDTGNQDHMFLSDAEGWAWGNELNAIEQFFLCEK